MSGLQPPVPGLLSLARCSQQVLADLMASSAGAAVGECAEQQVAMVADDRACVGGLAQRQGGHPGMAGGVGGLPRRGGVLFRRT